MSKKDYTKFSKNHSDEHNTVNDALIPEVTYPIPEDDIPEEPAIVEQKTVIFGKVVNCSKLNVRKHPSLGADILTCLVENTEMEIDEDKSTSEFYAVCTPAGLEGFCLKKFIEICK